MHLRTRTTSTKFHIGYFTEKYTKCSIALAGNDIKKDFTWSRPPRGTAFIQETCSVSAIERDHFREVLMLVGSWR
ncbi:hypothetical protein EUGRSUZ_K03140 [Eucalyptus grandis]|uniref:Uncharacterized protein n=2 Tax=Eucalyptus grandis TaxID=71139 RepID=A0ACC3IYP3_EUCGR|nr:hypothetical protein EUGRSUZ_K03140 [Eucalyptus grandis]